MLVGIGCNVLTSPQVEKSGQDGGRDSGCIADFISMDNEQEEGELSPAVEYRNLLATKLYDNTATWLASQIMVDTAEQVIFDCERKMVLGETQRLRWDRVSNKDRSNSGGMAALEEVVPLKLNADGTLLARHVATGTEKVLSAEYLW